MQWSLSRILEFLWLCGPRVNEIIHNTKILVPLSYTRLPRISVHFCQWIFTNPEATIFSNDFFFVFFSIIKFGIPADQPRVSIYCAIAIVFWLQPQIITFTSPNFRFRVLPRDSRTSTSVSGLPLVVLYIMLHGYRVSRDNEQFLISIRFGFVIRKRMENWDSVVDSNYGFRAEPRRRVMACTRSDNVVPLLGFVTAGTSAVDRCWTRLRG